MNLNNAEIKFVFCPNNNVFSGFEFDDDPIKVYDKRDYDAYFKFLKETTKKDLINYQIEDYGSEEKMKVFYKSKNAEWDCSVTFRIVPILIVNKNNIFQLPFYNDWNLMRVVSELEGK